MKKFQITTWFQRTFTIIDENFPLYIKILFNTITRFNIIPFLRERLLAKVLLKVNVMCSILDEKVHAFYHIFNKIEPIHVNIDCTFNSTQKLPESTIYINFNIKNTLKETNKNNAVIKSGMNIIGNCVVGRWRWFRDIDNWTSTEYDNKNIKFWDFEILQG